MKELALLLCCRTHPAEWSAKAPRVNPCAPCFVLAAAIHKAGWRKA